MIMSNATTDLTPAVTRAQGALNDYAQAASVVIGLCVEDGTIAEDLIARQLEWVARRLTQIAAEVRS